MAQFIHAINKKHPHACGQPQLLTSQLASKFDLLSTDVLAIYKELWNAGGLCFYQSFIDAASAKM